MYKLKNVVIYNSFQKIKHREKKNNSANKIPKNSQIKINKIKKYKKQKKEIWNTKK